MTSFQKIIKYGAIGFAIYLCLMIIGMIIFGVTLAFSITTGVEIFENATNEAIVTRWEEEYSNITELDIDLNVCKLAIKKGDTLKVDASNISEKFKCEVEGNKLKMKDSNFSSNFLNIADETPRYYNIYTRRNAI